jgi:dienelactone hydrolase
MGIINILNIEPHKVSRDLSGYFTYIYGGPKVGKTTLASQMPKPLLLAFEKGYNAIPGVLPQDISSWSEFKQVVTQLKQPAAKERYSTVAIDTVDVAANLCDKYVCSQNGVSTISEIPYGQGWNLLKKEFEDCFRSIAQEGYAIYFISHEKEGVFKRKDGTSYHQIVPSCPNTFNEIAKNLVDIYAYAEKYEDNGQAKVRLVIRSTDNSIDCGSRFKYIEPVIDMSYKALVDALNKAIDKAAETSGSEYVTNDRNTQVAIKTLDYDALLTEFNNLASQLMTKDGAVYG